jgi:hypothetical protein
MVLLVLETSSLVGQEVLAERYSHRGQHRESEASGITKDRYKRISSDEESQPHWTPFSVMLTII